MNPLAPRAWPPGLPLFALANLGLVLAFTLGMARPGRGLVVAACFSALSSGLAWAVTAPGRRQRRGAPARLPEAIWATCEQEREALRAEVQRLHAALSGQEGLMRVICHEIRTPLCVLGSYTQLIGDQLASSGTCDDAYVARMERAVRRMERLVSDLVDVARLESGRLRISPSPCDLAELCRQVAEEQEFAHGREIALSVPEATVPVFGDSGRLAQVVTNLMENAIAYSQPDRPVALSLRTGGGEAVIAVQDEGPGIAADKLPHLFASYYRVPGAQAHGTASAGLGLGLHLCKELVARHHGRIWVESEVGVGSTFLVALPLAS